MNKIKLNALRILHERLYRYGTSLSESYDPDSIYYYRGALMRTIMRKNRIIKWIKLRNK